MSSGYVGEVRELFKLHAEACPRDTRKRRKRHVVLNDEDPYGRRISCRPHPNKPVEAPMPENTEKFRSWAIVELLGHKRLAGFVYEETIAGAALLRVDVPATESIVSVYDELGRWVAQQTKRTQAFTTYAGAGSIYRLTPVAEDVAREAARQFMSYEDPLPIQMPRQLPARAEPASDDSGIPSLEQLEEEEQDVEAEMSR